MAFVSMSSEHSGFPGSARTHCTSFLFPVILSELCISVRLQWKEVMPGSISFAFERFNLGPFDLVLLG